MADLEITCVADGVTYRLTQQQPGRMCQGCAAWRGAERGYDYALCNKLGRCSRNQRDGRTWVWVAEPETETAGGK